MQPILPVTVPVKKIVNVTETDSLDVNSPLLMPRHREQKRKLSVNEALHHDPPPKSSELS